MPFFPEPQPQPEVNPYFMPIDIPANPMSAYLPLAGGTLTGDLIINANTTINGTTNMNNWLDMGNNIIKNLADGTTITDAATVGQITGGSAITTQQTSALRLSQTRCTVNNGQIVNLSRITSAGVLMETKFFGELFGVVDALATNCFFIILLPFDSTEIDDISKIAVTADRKSTRLNSSH